MPPSELPEEPSAVPPDPAIAHLDGEVLALRALGEDAGTAADDAHLTSCARCQAELDQLRAVVSTSRSLTDADRPRAAPPSVWEGIQAQVRGGGSGATSSSEPTPASSGTEVVPFAARRRRRSWSTSVLVAASVASLAVGVVLSAVATRESEPPSPAPQVVAAASLAALPDHTGSGEATIVQRSGTDYLQIDASDLSQGQGFYEVWLIDPKTMQMVGLGALDSAEGLFPIPDGLDLSKYRLVDVSLEPMDGQPTHSGNSIVRGELAT